MACKGVPEMKLYWHKIPIEDQQTIIKYGNMTYGEFLAKFRQPKWCGYHNALAGKMGCWSLIRPGWVFNQNYCRNCECNKGFPNVGTRG